MKNMFNVTTVLSHNLLQTNPYIRHNFSTQVFRKRAAQLHYVGPELHYIFWRMWRMQGFVCKRLWGEMVVTLNMFFIRNNFPAYED